MDQQVLGQNQVLLSKEKFLVTALSVEKSLTLLDEVKLAQVQDESLMELQHKTGFNIEDDCLAYHGCTVILRVLKTRILEICHDSSVTGYPSTCKTFEALIFHFGGLHVEGVAKHM